MIVCTAEILNQCLSRGFITIKQINLLIFDEAHHTKKNHAYSRIIKDYYSTEKEEAARPRVFGMTASPMDGKTDVAQAANDLENLLHSTIATSMDASLTDAVQKPKEQVLNYDILQIPYATPLLQAVRNQYGDVEVFKRVFDTTPIIARELGSWCADQYVIEALSAKRIRAYESKVERKLYARFHQSDVKALDDKQAQVRSAVDFVEQKRMELSTVGVRTSNLSSKVHALCCYLRNTFERPSSHRCIVFVEQRHTARLLCALFEKIGTEYMRPAFLVGGNSPEIEEDHFSFRQQVLTLRKFGKGEFNCLFATSVAEEGLDVPDCNLVIRFDLFRTMIQYVQSRGRARQRDSKFIHMKEQGNSKDEDVIREARYYEARMRAFCQSVPEDKRLLANEDDLEEIMAKEKYLPFYIEESTGAKLTYMNALGYLANFVSVGVAATDELLHPTYIVCCRGMKFIAEVLLPGNAPIRSVIGEVCNTKALARRSAAFLACRELRKLDFIDEHLMPKHHEGRLRTIGHAIRSVNTDKTNQYVMRTKPSIWKETRRCIPTELWLTIVDFPDGLERNHQPLVFLTRTSMPDFPSFPVFLNDARPSKVVSHRLKASLKIDEVTIQKLNDFTLRVFKDVFSKIYEQDTTKMSYWLAPAATTVGRLSEGANVTPERAIDWKLLDRVLENEEHQWTQEMPSGNLVNKFLIDRWDGGRKFFSVAIDPTLRPLDPIPKNTAKAKWKENIIGYSVSLWKNAREKAVWNPDQPVVEAEWILTRRNLLATPDPKETSLKTKAFLCPEPLRISALSTAIVASCLIWPAIIHRFESYLIATEACSMVGVECSVDVALAAFTKDSDNSGEHENEERVNFQQGMGENYERLEFIGDTFLKTATTISTFVLHPDDNEYQFHVTRMKMLRNDNLFTVAVKLELYEYIRSIAFTRRQWYPDGIKLLEGKGVNKDEDAAIVKHHLGDKTIADVCEALIGAAFVTHDRPGETWHENQWQDALRAVTKLVESENHLMTTWNDYRLAYEKPSYQTGDVTASQRDLAEKVERKHAYHFNYPRLLRSAFIHPSQPFMFEHLPNYQRLEFLGDALLDMASITHLFYRFPGKDPQWLTEHKMAMVSNKFLGAVCVNIGFHKHLRYTHSPLEHQIKAYVDELLEAKHTAGDSRDYWTTVSDPPKCLPDIIESYVGAIFIDSDFDFSVVHNFFNTHIKWYFEDMSLYDTFANNHPCTHLHNLLQTAFGCQDYRLMAKEMPLADGIDLERKDVVAVVMVHNEIIAWTKGKSGKYARTRVASQAIDVIQGLAPFEFRSKFGCTCHLKGDGSTNGDGVGELAAVMGDCCI